MHDATFPVHSPPSASASPLPDLASPAPAPLRTRDLSLALLGLLALGGAAALGGVPASGAGLRLIPSVLLVQLPALGLTAPALIAIHQFLRLGAAPEQLASALGRALIHAGRVAGGLAVVVLFFAATTRLATPMLACSLLGVGVFTSATACVELTAAECRAARVVAPQFTLLLIAWLGLSWLVALRIGVDVATWVLGFGGLGA
jgi:hypothetical protein